MTPRSFANGALVAAALVALAAAAAADPPAPGAPSPPAPSGPAPAPPPAPPAPPAAPLPPLPPGVAARVRNRDLTVEDVRSYLVQRAKKDWDDPKTPSGVVMEVMIRTKAAQLEALRLGIVVTEADYQAAYAEIDARVRKTTNGATTLETLRQQQGTSLEQFRANLMHELTKERIAAHKEWMGDKLPVDEQSRLVQAEVVMGEVMKRTPVVRTGLPAGVVARVGTTDLTEADYGLALSIHLSPSDRRSALLEQCKRSLLEQEGLTMTPADVDRVLELDKPLWLRAREDATQPELRTLAFESYVQVKYGATVEDLRASPFHRALLALRDRVRRTVTEDDVLVAWGRGSTTEWGPVILVTDIAVSFQIPKALTGSVRRRTRDEALRIARDVARRLQAGEKGDAIVTEIDDRKERGVVAQPRRLLNFGNDLLLFDAAERLTQGAWSDIVELASEFHILRRDGDRRPGTFEEMKPIVREKLVAERASDWMNKALAEEVRLASDGA